MFPPCKPLAPALHIISAKAPVIPHAMPKVLRHVRRSPMKSMPIRRVKIGMEVVTMLALIGEVRLRPMV